MTILETIKTGIDLSADEAREGVQRLPEDYFDANVLKGDILSMEHPFFALKAGDMRNRADGMIVATRSHPIRRLHRGRRLQHGLGIHR